ncbi:MAG TPA: dTDP-glucose 4,6-dehydratase [Candidatus Onthovivens sp.]|nr:dTDP-glucose 4,6-dehydratase [Candidatus Onthovivens sp.]
MKILITGGLGFIGCNFVEYFLGKRKKDKIVVVDKCTYAANKRKLDEFKHFKNFKFYKEDITNLKAMDRIFKREKFDYVLNFAAETSVDRSFLSPELFFDVNVNGVINLLKLSRLYLVKRFHQISTDEVYGDLALDSKKIFKETDQLNPKNPYSLSKATADEYILMFHKIYGYDVTISRSTNNYGPYQAKDKLIPLVIARANMNAEIPIYGTGNNMRNWLYVYDHCVAIDKIIEFGKSGEIYNIGTTETYDNLYIVHHILDYMKKDYKLIKFVNDRLVHDQKYNLDCSKIKKELDFEPVYNLEAALDDTIDSYLK